MSENSAQTPPTENSNPTQNTTTPQPEPKTTETPKSNENSDPSLLNQADPPKTTEGEKKEEPKKAEGAPEKYEPWKLPEGYELDEAHAKTFSDKARELGLSQDQAQGLMDLYAKVSQEASDSALNLWKDTQKNWVETIKSDPEIGGKIDQIKTDFDRLLTDAFGENQKAKAEFKEAMDYTGAGNNPAFVRFAKALIDKFGTGKPVQAGGPTKVESPTGSRPSAAEAMYPHLANKG